VSAEQSVGKKDTTQRGDIAEAYVVAALVGAGHRLLRPLSAACRYDLLIDNEDGSFTRVQCKSDDRLSARSAGAQRSAARRTSREQLPDRRKLTRSWT
jgi:hypothetical protein